MLSLSFLSSNNSHLGTTSLNLRPETRQIINLPHYLTQIKPLYSSTPLFTLSSTSLLNTPITLLNKISSRNGNKFGLSKPRQLSIDCMLLTHNYQVGAKMEGNASHRDFF